MSRRTVLPRQVVESRVIAIVRGGGERNLMPTCRTLVDAGIGAIEITTNTTGWEQAVRALAAEASVAIGAGTVLTPGHVVRAAEAGASYVVAPNVDLDVARAAAERGLGWLPGALSPTEIIRAWGAGATAVKIFPAASVGGASYVRQVRAPLDDIPLVPTGGVVLDDISEYLASGAVAVGIGSPLIGDALEGGDLRALVSRAIRAVEAARHHG